MTRVPEFQSAKWNEPIVMDMGRAGARGRMREFTAARCTGSPHRVIRLTAAY